MTMLPPNTETVVCSFMCGHSKITAQEHINRKMNNVVNLAIRQLQNTVLKEGEW